MSLISKNMNPFILFLGLFFCAGAFAQQSAAPAYRKGISLTYNQTDVGRNITAAYELPLGRRTALSLGLKSHLTIPPSEKSPYNATLWELYRNQFVVRKPVQRLGANVGFQYALYQREKMSIGLLLNVQASKMGTDNILPFLDLDSLGNAVLTPYIFRKEPMWALESFLGLGLTTALSDHIALTQSLGGGVSKYFDKLVHHVDGSTYVMVSSRYWMFSYMYRVGFIYTF